MVHNYSFVVLFVVILTCSAYSTERRPFAGSNVLGDKTICVAKLWCSLACLCKQTEFSTLLLELFGESGLEEKRASAGVGSNEIPRLSK